MGVQGLWDILESVGHPVKVEGLEGKVLGVDANIWLYKFIRGFRDKDNATNIEGHKLGLYNRIAKLLFYRIKPVFVFDGPAPILKRRTLERRQNIRNKTLSKVQDAAMKALANQIKLQYPNADIDHLRITLPELRSNNLVAAEKLGEEDFNLFYLPPESEMKKKNDDEKSESESEYDSDIEIVSDLQYSTKVDVNSKDFQQLPPEVRYEILQDVKSSRRRIRNAESLPDDANSFSNLQLERLRTRREIQQKIEECEKDICTNYTGELADGRTIQAYRVQSDATSTILYRNNTYDPRGVITLKEEASTTAAASTSKISSQSQSQNEDRQPAASQMIERSSQMRNKTLSKVQDAAMEASANQIESQYPKADVDHSRITLPEFESNNLMAAEKLDKEDSDLFYLPPESEMKKKNDDEKSESESEYDSDIEIVGDLQYSTKVDVNSKPSHDVSIEILQEIKSLRSRIRDAERLPDDANSFSNIQLEPREIQEKIGESEKDICIDYTGELTDGLIKQVQSEATSTIPYRNNTNDPPEVISLEKEASTIASASTSGISSQSQSQNIGRQAAASQVIERSSSQMTSQSEHILNAQRSTNKVTNKIIEDAKELLRLFGIPYMDATGEAEAQCAKLEELKLTAGTITDDSDIWLFGAQNVFRYFFSDDKYVMQYKMTDIEYHIRMTRDNLVCFAMLVGSDYTDGIMNVGPVTALEILSEFPGEGMGPLIKYSDWYQEALRDKKLTKGPDKKKRKKLLKYQLPEEFPSRAVYEGYLRPCANSSAEEFTWGVPELDELREYARRNFGWDQKKVDEKLLPVMKKLSEGKIQKTIDSFFFKTQANRNPEMFRSKRVNQALNKIAKRAALAPGGAPPKVVDEVNLSEDEE